MALSYKLRTFTYKTKWCNKCRRELPIEDFYRNRKRSTTGTSYFSSWCKECEKACNRRGNQARRYALKMLVLRAYGGNPPVCACCPDNEPSRGEERFLTIDHIVPARRKANSARKDCGTHLYEYLRDNNFPPGYRVLCYNCNCSTGKSPRPCPHEEKRIQLARVAD